MGAKIINRQQVYWNAGEATGSEAYHGMAANLARQIKQDGLKAPAQHLGERSWVYTTIDKAEALQYAKNEAEESGANHVALAVVDLKKSGLHPHDMFPENYRVKRGKVNPEAIKRIEIYRIDDLTRPVDIL